MRRSPRFDCLIPSLLRPMSHPPRKRTRARFDLTATHTGARGVSHPVSCLADILEVLLRAGFVLSTPGTPELCSSAYTLQVALCAQSAIRNLSNACRSIMSESVEIPQTGHAKTGKSDSNCHARWSRARRAAASLTKHFLARLLGTSWVRGWYQNARIFEAVRFGRLK